MTGSGKIVGLCEYVKFLEEQNAVLQRSLKEAFINSYNSSEYHELFVNALIDAVDNKKHDPSLELFEQDKEVLARTYHYINDLLKRADELQIELNSFNNIKAPETQSDTQLPTLPSKDDIRKDVDSTVTVVLYIGYNIDCGYYPFITLENKLSKGLCKCKSIGAHASTYKTTILYKKELNGLAAIVVGELLSCDVYYDNKASNLEVVYINPYNLPGYTVGMAIDEYGNAIDNVLGKIKRAAPYIALYGTDGNDVCLDFCMFSEVNKPCVKFFKPGERIDNVMFIFEITDPSVIVKLMQEKQKIMKSVTQ